MIHLKAFMVSVNNLNHLQQRESIETTHVCCICMSEIIKTLLSLMYILLFMCARVFCYGFLYYYHVHYIFVSKITKISAYFCLHYKKKLLNACFCIYILSKPS